LYTYAEIKKKLQKFLVIRAEGRRCLPWTGLSDVIWLIIVYCSGV